MKYIFNSQTRQKRFPALICSCGVFAQSRGRGRAVVTTLIFTEFPVHPLAHSHLFSLCKNGIRPHVCI